MPTSSEFSNCSDLEILMDSELMEKLKDAAQNGISASQSLSGGFRLLLQAGKTSGGTQRKICVSLNASDPKKYILLLTVVDNECEPFDANNVVAVRKHEFKGNS